MRFLGYIFFFFIQTILLFGQEKKYHFLRHNDDTKSYTKDFESKNLDSSLDSLQKTGYYTLTIDSIKNETDARFSMKVSKKIIFVLPIPKSILHFFF